jgi:hypothetical protein
MLEMYTIYIFFVAFPENTCNIPAFRTKRGVDLEYGASAFIHPKMRGNFPRLFSKHEGIKVSLTMMTRLRSSTECYKFLNDLC